MKFLIIAAVILVFSNIVNAYVQEDLSVIGKLKVLESTVEGRLGVFAVNTANGDVIDYRADETFPTGCTSKVMGVSAVLRKSMSEPSLLLTYMKYSEADLQEWSPVTKKYLSNGMTIQDLCEAAISFSDNTAMNLLLKTIGGVQGMNDFAYSIGDLSFRQDNDWPAEAFSGGVDNLKDSSTPKSMMESFRKLTIGEILDAYQRDLLITWLVNIQTDSYRIRSAVPNGWIVGDKTGTGAAYGSTNDIAIIWPPNHTPMFIGIYYTTNNEHAKKREDVIADATRILIEEFVNNDTTLVNQG